MGLTVPVHVSLLASPGIGKQIQG